MRRNTKTFKEFVFLFLLLNSILFSKPMVSAGSNFTIAVDEDGYVYAWGNNDFGQLGDGTNINSNIPVRVKGVGGIGYLSRIKMVSAGSNFTVAVDEDGYVYAWGNNEFGQLGDGTFNNSNVPVKVKGPNGIGYLSGIKMVSAGNTHVLALKEDGTVYTWGTLQFFYPEIIVGLLGHPVGSQLTSYLYSIPSIGQSNYPVQVMFEICHFDPEQGPFYEYKPLTGVKMVSAGYNHSVVLMEEGKVYAWGEDGWDQCGYGNNAILCIDFPVEVETYIYNWYTKRNEPLTDVKYISAGESFTAAIREDGSLWVWGRRGIGIDGYARPRDYINNLLTIDCASNYAIGLKKDMTVWFLMGWPYQITSLYGIIDISANGWRSSWNGCWHVLCLKADGTVWSFGDNSSGQLGNGKTYNCCEIEPQKVLGLDGIGYLNLFRISVTPNPYDFPITPSGSKSLMNFLVKNLSKSPISIGKIYIEGENKDEFEIFMDYVSYSTLKPGDVRSFKVIFKPLRTGEKNIKVIVPYGNSKREVYIKGVCGAVENKVVIKGRVFDKNTGNPIENALVFVSSYVTKTDENGYYTIDWASPGIYNYVITKEGYVSSFGTIELTPSSIINKDFYLTPSSAGDKIEIIEVNTKYNLPLYFLGKVSFPVEFSLSCDWKNYTPYKAIFKTVKSNKIYEWEATEQNPCFPKVTIDIGELEPGDSLRIKIISTEGIESEEKEFIFVVMKPIIGNFGVVDLGSSFYYQIPSFLENFSFINEGIDSDFIPTEIPFFGGSSINLLFTPVLKAEVINNTVEYSLSFNDLINGGNIGPVEISFSPYFGLSGTYSPYKMKWDWNGFIGLITDLEVETPPFYLPIPIPIPVYVKGAFILGLNTRVDILDIQPVKLNGSFVVEPAIRGIFGVGISDVLAAEGWVQGGAEISLQYPYQPNLKQILIVVKTGYTVYYIIGEYESGVSEWQWQLYGGKGLPEYKNFISEEKPKLIPRDYIYEKNYGLFTGGKDRQITKRSIQDKTYTISKSTIQEMVFPLPQPKLISKRDKLYLVYLYDDPERTSINRTKLIFTYYDGNQWSQPIPVFDDKTLDFNSDLVFFENGDAICVWENVKEVLNDNFPIQNIPEKMEISVARYNSSENKWQDLINLTNDDYYDRFPIVRGEIDDLICIWIKNKGNTFIANQQNPDELYFAKWNGTNWSIPEKIAEFTIPILKTDFIYKNGNGCIVLNCDTDGNLQSIEDREIYLIKYENGIWKEPERLTNDNEIDDNPKLILTSDGKTKLFWVKNEGIFEVENFEIENKILVKKENYNSHISNFKITNSEDGKISILWVEPSGYISDIYSIIYDPNFNSWSEKINLTQDEKIEKYLSPVYYGNENLAIIYLQQTYQTKAISSKSDIPNLKSFNMPYLTKSEICFLQVIFGNDISIEKFTILPENTLPGNFVYCEVGIVNKGEKVVNNFDIVFYINDNEIYKETIDQIINPGEKKALFFEYMLPDINTPFLIKCIVDPENKINDRDLSNNSKTIKYGLPDLKIENLSVSKIKEKLHITVKIRNLGISDSGVFTLKIKDKNKQNILQKEIENLKMSETQDIIFEIENNYNEFFVVVDEENKIEESNEENNIFHFIYELLEKTGDLNGDKEVDIVDVILCLRQAIRIDEMNFIFADINNDGEVDISDVILILKKALNFV